MFWASAYLLVSRVFSKQDDTWKSGGTNSGHVNHPADVLLKGGNLDAGEELIVGDAIYPS